MALTHIQIMNAKPQKKDYKLADSDALYLVVRPNGSKLWRMNYRHLGRQKTLYFGAWPEVGLAAARQRRDAGDSFVMKPGYIGTWKTIKTVRKIYVIVG